MDARPAYILSIQVAAEVGAVEEWKPGGPGGAEVELTIKRADVGRLADVFERRRDERRELLLQRMEQDNRMLKNLDRVALVVVVGGFVVLLCGIVAVALVGGVGPRINVGVVTGVNVAVAAYLRTVVMSMQRQVNSRLGDLSKYMNADAEASVPLPGKVE